LIQCLFMHIHGVLCKKELLGDSKEIELIFKSSE